MRTIISSSTSTPLTSAIRSWMSLSPQDAVGVPPSAAMASRSIVTRASCERLHFQSSTPKRGARRSVSASRYVSTAASSSHRSAFNQSTVVACMPLGQARGVPEQVAVTGALTSPGGMAPSRRRWAQGHLHALSLAKVSGERNSIALEVPLQGWVPDPVDCGVEQRERSRVSRDVVIDESPVELAGLDDLELRLIALPVREHLLAVELTAGVIFI